MFPGSEIHGFHVNSCETAGAALGFQELDGLKQDRKLKEKPLAA
jgi:hypothetical protein